MKKIAINTFVLGSVLFCLAGSSLMADSSADVVVNSSVAAASLDKAALKDILTGKTVYWEGGQAIIIVVIPGKTDDALQEASGMSASAFKTFWQRLTFSGRGKQPKEADSVEKALAMVAETKGAVAFVPAGIPLSGVKKIDVK